MKFTHSLHEILTLPGLISFVAQDFLYNNCNHYFRQYTSRRFQSSGAVGVSWAAGGWTT